MYFTDINRLYRKLNDLKRTFFRLFSVIRRAGLPDKTPADTSILRGYDRGLPIYRYAWCHTVLSPAPVYMSHLCRCGEHEWHQAVGITCWRQTFTKVVVPLRAEDGQVVGYGIVCVCMYMECPWSFCSPLCLPHPMQVHRAVEWHPLVVPTVGEAEEVVDYLNDELGIPTQEWENRARYAGVLWVWCDT